MAIAKRSNDVYITWIEAERLAGTLPTGCPMHALGVELDTGKVFYWGGQSWELVGGEDGGDS